MQPKVSSGLAPTRFQRKLLRITRSAAANTRSTSPQVNVRCCITLLPCCSNTSGAPSASACVGLTTGCSSSYSTRIRSRASSASARLLAATAATGSPTKRALSTARQYAPQPSGTLTIGLHQRRTSSPVSTATTPSAAAAALASTRTMRACGCGLRRIAQCSMPGSARLSTNGASPLTSAGSSMRLTGRPT